MARVYDKSRNQQPATNPDFDYDKYDRQTSEMVSESEQYVTELMVRVAKKKAELKQERELLKEATQDHWELIRNRAAKRGQPQQPEIFDGTERNNDDGGDSDDDQG